MFGAFFLGALLAASRTVCVYTAPAGDGGISGARDGVMTRAPDHLARSGFMLVGHKWNASYKSLLEFEIPDAVFAAGTSGVVRATLRVNALTSPGCYPRKDGGGPQCDLYLYYAPEANGMIELSDDNHGVKFPGCVLQSGTTLNHRSGFSADVTEYVREAVRRKSDYLGVRLQTEEHSDSAWIFQTSENPYDIKERTSRPSLTIEYAERQERKGR